MSRCSRWRSGKVAGTCDACLGPRQLTDLGDRRNWLGGSELACNHRIRYHVDDGRVERAAQDRVLFSDRGAERGQCSKTLCLQATLPRTRCVRRR